MLDGNSAVFKEINKPQVVFVRYRLTEKDQLAIKVGTTLEELGDEDAAETVLSRVK